MQNLSPSWCIENYKKDFLIICFFGGKYKPNSTYTSNVRNTDVWVGTYAENAPSGYDQAQNKLAIEILHIYEYLKDQIWVIAIHSNWSGVQFFLNMYHCPLLFDQIHLL